MMVLPGLAGSVLLAVVLSLAPAEAPPVPASPDLSDKPLCRVKAVGGGYRIYLEPDGPRGPQGLPIVRLAGVGLPSSESPAGREILAYVANLLKGERVWVLEVPTWWAESGAAYLYRWPDRLCVNLEVVRQGYGWADEHSAMETRPDAGFQPARQLAPAGMVAALTYWQRHAKAAGKGLWAPNAPSSAPATQPVVRPGGPQAPPAATAGGLAAAGAAAPAGASATRPAADDTIVYVTASGTKYHREGCPSLRKSRKPIPLKDARGKYEPCKLCNPPG